MATDSIFPLREVRAALQVKVRDMSDGRSGLVIGVIWSRKYGQPMLHFVGSPQSSRQRCAP